MRINPNIFKAYDIRGKFPSELNEAVAEKVGQAAAIYFIKNSRKKPNVAICEDLRTSSRALKEGIIKGLIAQNVNVWEGGRGTTPYFYFLLHKVKPDGGIMITASHSPAEYNGFKIQNKKLHAVSLGSGLEVIRTYVERKMIRPQSVLGEIKKLPNFYQSYLDFITEGISIKPMKIVVDTAGGAETLFISQLFSYFPALIYKPLFFEADGTFRKHSPNPILPEAQQFVKDALKKESFRFGVVFDGDSDRIIFLDEKGAAVRSDFIFALIAKELLEKEKNAIFVVTLNTSKSVREYIERLGGKIKLSPQGYPYLQKLMRKHRATAGVELSGHYHFRRTFFRDSTLLPLLYLLQYLSHTKEPLSRIVCDLQKYISSKELAFPVVNNKDVIKRVKNFYARGQAKLTFLDGITVEFPDWWFNLRAANTEPVVRLALEAKTEELYDQKLQEIEKIIKGG